MTGAAATALGWVLAGVALLGTCYTLAAAVIVRRFFGVPEVVSRDPTAVSLLKPLHGAEPRLAENLRTFLAQDHAGTIELICGTGRPDDPAAAVVTRLHAEDERVVLISGAGDRAPGNAKVVNLARIAARASHDILVISDSDIAVAPDYLSRLLAALDAPGIGAVTCLYRGRGDAGFWSMLGAAGISWQFLPGAVFGVTTRTARPCMGSTIALRRDTLDRIGGFAAFADILADDHAIGAAVRRLGLAIAVPRMLVVHACDEAGAAALWRHELRWSATIRGLVPAAHAASVIAMPFPLALIAAPFVPAPVAATLIAATLAARLLIVRAVDAVAGSPTAPVWLLPIRDLFSFAVHLAASFTRSVDWRGQRLRMGGNGRIAVTPENSA